MEHFILCLLSLSVGGSLIALVILLMRRGNKLPKSFYYYAWLLVLLRLALPIPGRFDLELPKAEAPVAEFVAAPTDPQPQVIVDLSKAEKPQLTATAADSAPVTAPGATTPALQRILWKIPNLTTAWWLALVWLAGFVLCLGRELTAYFRFRSLLRKTLTPPPASDLAIYDRLTGKRRPQLRRSAAVDTPMLMGILHPMLLLPDRDYAPDTLECIFKHELTHFRRGDILYKWFAVPVLAAHWFNPLTLLIRRDIDRCCELSCDERLLGEMDHDQRKSYGETLLVLAARSTTPKTSLSTTFATEKKNLKERLVHIMNFSPKSKKAILAGAALLVIVAICCIFFGPSAEPAMEGDAYVVKNVDQLLKAIDSDRTIILEPGVYDLTTAKGYGLPVDSDKYYWNEEFDGYALVLRDIKNLTITGRDKETCEIVTRPRYAAVLGFSRCENISLASFTAGHVEGPGRCVGAVVKFDQSETASIEDCILYGCGTYGVEGWDTKDVDVANCDIKECSLGATYFVDSESIHLRDSRIFDCGNKDEWGAYYMFYYERSKSCSVSECTITDNKAICLMDANSCKDIYFVSNQLENNVFAKTVFNAYGAPPMVQGCSFKNLTGTTRWATSAEWVHGDILKKDLSWVLDLNGEPLSDEDLAAMEYCPTPFSMPAPTAGEPEPAEPSPTTPADADISTEGTTVVEVSTVDEFLAAIAPNTTVVLAEGTYELNKASDYGTGWEDYYRWTGVFDGFELEIMNVTNFHIQGAGQNKTILSAIPRYAEVLLFTDCDNFSIQGITAGHTQEPGSCTGGVLTFVNCSDAAIDGCGLYGCGIYGIIAESSENFAVTNTEIYDCSYGAVRLDTCKNFSFDSCDIHDCPLPLFNFPGAANCPNITVDGEEI